VTTPSIDDREAEAVHILSKRLGTLRRFVLIPLALISAATSVPAYIVYRNYQLEAQWATGSEVALHVPLWTGLVAMIPAVVCFGLSVLVYRVIRDSRLRVWKRELCRELDLPETQLDELGRIFH